MKILFVLPTEPHLIFGEHDPNISFHHKFMLKMLSGGGISTTFPILAALTPEQHSIEFIEGRPYDIDYDKQYDLVGISCMTKDAFRAYEVAEEFRKRGVTVILGGWHPSVLPREAKQHADSVVIGEAEETWPQLLKDSEKGKLKPFYEIERPVAAKLIPRPRNIYPKGTQLVIHATRGCPNRCEFCAITHMKFRKILRIRPIEDVVKEIRSQPEKNFIFYDDSLTLNRHYSKQLFDEIKGLNKKFLAFGNINQLGKDEKFLKLASEAGCTGWAIGFESISQQSLNSIGKTNKVEEYAENIKKIHDHGMTIIGFFIFGFDPDKPDIFDKTDEFVRKNEIDAPRSYILIPYPGTPLYNRLEKEGRILTKDWSKYQGHVVFQPKNMTPEELYTNTIRLYKKWCKTSNIIKRIIKSMKLGFHPMIASATNNFVYKYMRYPN
jgi:radical SAM superfamily enzyme YgiQ (UPF0313 family)